MSKLFDDASLAMIPSAYKDGKLYSIRPTDGSGDFTFSRGSNLAATRVDVNGLIEKGRENHLLQSNNFTTTWTTAAAGTSPTLTSGQSGYNGSNDAWLLDKSAVAFSRVEQSVSLSGVWTFSVYAKAGTLDIMRLRDSSNANAAEFNLTSGTANPYGSIAQSITSVGSGWYRCSATFSGSTTQVSIYLQWSQADAGNIYIQDAQLEAGLVATDYIETGASTAQAGILEDMPRLDYSGGASCPALLLEPQRTNLVAHSEYYGSSEWSKRTSDSTAVPVVTNNYAVSPEGVKNASRVVVTKPSTDNDFAVITDFGGVTKSAGDKFASSVYLKATDASQVGKIVDIYSYESGGGYWTIKSHTLTDDWVRVDAVSTANTSTGNVELLNIGKARASAGGTTLANMATDFLVYGAQFEEGSYPTSYIPTYGSSVTRSVDNPASVVDSSLIGQTSGTIFVEATIDNLSLANACWVAVNDGSTTTNRVLMYASASNRYRALVRFGGNTLMDIGGADINAGERFKACLTYGDGVINFYVNGVLNATASGDTTTTSPLSHIFLDESSQNNCKISQFAVFPTALTDSECIALTTL
jgi:hypothetical protein